MTRNDIRVKAEEEQRKKAAEKASSSNIEEPLEENLNRMRVEGEARTVEDAIAVLSKDADAGDKHPEKRMKAAYEAFEKERLPELKAENPNLRLSQLKQMLRKEWMKHPSNPFNKNVSDYRAK